MTREELIKSLRGCASYNWRCSECSFEYKEDCTDRLMKAAADMLEQDAVDLKLLDGELEVSTMKSENEYKYEKYQRVSEMTKQLYGLGLTPPRTDCKFYFEQRDMCAIIPCCTLHEGLGNCPCDGCKNYRSKYEPEKTVEKTAPAVDAVGVIRCKDCKNAWHSIDGLRCEAFGTYLADPMVSPDEYCSRGERKE